MSTKPKFTPIAIAALAGLAIASMTTTALANRLVDSSSAGQAPVTGGDVASTEIALEAEAGANSNDAFDKHTELSAPNDKLFSVVGELSKSDSDGTCRDVDFIKLTKLIPQGEYSAQIGGAVAPESHIGWYTLDGNLILQIVPGETDDLPIVADDNGIILLAVSADSDGDYDGNIDDTTSPHEICGKYSIAVEINSDKASADINGDSLVDITDVRIMLALIGSVDSPQADLTRDGIVDSADLRVLADAVTDRRAERVAEKKLKRLERQRIRAERKAAQQAIKAARKAERAARRR